MRKSLQKILICSGFIIGCNNYNLLDKFENPGGGTAHERLYAFISSIQTMGDTTGLINGGCSGIGAGVGRADCSCTDLAKAGGLLKSPNAKFVAWLSTDSFDMTCRINGNNSNNCQNTGGPTWYNTRNEVLATSYADLFDGQLSAQLIYNENKVISFNGSNVWTGTDANGLRAAGGAPASNCYTAVSWTSTAGTGSVGTVGVLNGSWSNNAGVPSCTIAYPIYCFAVP